MRVQNWYHAGGKVGDWRGSQRFDLKDESQIRDAQQLCHREIDSLARQYGNEYEDYKLNVPAWLPRLRPW